MVVAGEAIRWLMQELLPSVPPDCKVPLLYVVDSIFKNVKEPYISLATNLIVAAVCEAFRVASSQDRDRLVRLTKLWQRQTPPVFPPSIFQAIYGYFQPWIDQKLAQQSGARAAPLAHRHQPPKPVGYATATIQSAPNGHQRRKRLRVDLEEKLMRTMRDLLHQLQADLSEANPMTLEELMAADPHRAQELRTVAEQQLKASLGGDLALPGNLNPQSTDDLKACVRDAERILHHLEPLYASQEAGMAAAAQTVRGALDQLLQKSVTRLGASENLRRLDNQQAASLPPFQAEVLTRPNPQLVRSLFSLPFVCPGDALCFKSKSQLQAHEEILVQRRVERQDSGRSRLWHCTATEWMEDPTDTGAGLAPGNVKENAKASAGTIDEAKSQTTFVEMDESIPVCKICGEQFEMHHDDDAEVWLYKDAIRVRIVNDAGEPATPGSNETTIVHRSCLATVDKNSLAAGVVKYSFLNQD